MKKIIGSLIVIFVAIAACVNTVNAQTLPDVEKTIPFATLKGSCKGDSAAMVVIDSSEAKQAMKFALSGAYASSFVLDSGAVINTIWDVTGVGSRGGITETQQLYFYTAADGNDYVALVRKGATTVLKNGKIKVHRGDETNSPWK